MKKNKIMCGLVCVFALLLASFALADDVSVEVTPADEVVVEIANDGTWTGTAGLTFTNEGTCEESCENVC